MSRLTEKKIIEIFQSRLNHKFVSEDVEYFKIGKKYFVLKIDTLVESTDIPKNTSLQYAARKSVISCISDFAAKGIKPNFGIVSVVLPRKLSKKKIEDLAIGFRKASKEFGIKILGGDTNEGKEISISFTLFGITNKIIKRKGAKLNDIIISSGPFGYSSAGLFILQKKKKHSQSFGTKAKNAVLNPKSRLMFGLKNKNYFSSSMDSSDGLSTTLNEMAEQSKRKFIITDIPAQRDIFDFATSNRLDPMNLIFNGGEEYEIIATVNPSDLAKIKKYAKIHHIQLYEIGYVTKGNGVYLQKNSRFIKIKDKGWHHFQ
jgi:thiamine-monophosphate kinase